MESPYHVAETIPNPPTQSASQSTWMKMTRITSSLASRAWSLLDQHLLLLALWVSILYLNIVYSVNDLARYLDN